MNIWKWLATLALATVAIVLTDAIHYELGMHTGDCVAGAITTVFTGWLWFGRK